MESDTYDPLDRRLAHALQIDARAPFSRIADVLGVSDQTVARRYARLRSSGSLRVQGLTDPYTQASAPWVLRVRCAPNAAARVADALARRDDTAWVHLTSGGTEVVCMVTTYDGRSESLLLDLLPRTPRVEGVTAHYLLRTFARGLSKIVAAHSGLTRAQIKALEPVDDSEGAVRSTGLNDEDRLLLRELARDGRASLATLADAVGWSPSAVRRRMSELIRSGTLFFEVDVDARLFPALSGWSLLWLTVEPAVLDTVGRAIAEHPGVGFVAATTGPTNLYATVACPNTPDLYAYITGRIAQLPGIRHLETAPVLRNIKHHH